MKNLICSIGLILVGLFSYGQYPITQGLGNSATTKVKTNALEGKVILTAFADTTAANTEGYLKMYDGAVIKTTTPISALWYRNLATTQWVQILPGGSGSGLQSWEIGGNFNWAGAATGNEALGWQTGVNKGINFVTNGVTNIALNSGGLTLKGVVSDTTANKVMTFNPTTKEWGYGYWYGGSGAPGSGTVTSISQGWGIVNTPDPITSTGTVEVDSNAVKTVLDGSYWKLTGNSGTTAGTNFIGTTDAVDLVIKAGGDQIARFYGDGLNKVDIGGRNVVTGDFAKAFGNADTASGESAIAIGTRANAIGNNTFAAGENTFANGLLSVAFGVDTRLDGTLSFGMGESNIVKGYGGTVFGTFNDTSDASNPAAIAPTNRLFQIGNGLADISRSNAITVLGNGKTGIGTTTPDSLLTVEQGIWGKRGLRLSGIPSGVGTKALRIDASGNVTSADTTAGGGSLLTPTETRVCYVDSTYGNNTTARVGMVSLPFATIDRALDSLGSQGGVIYIGIGTFASPSAAKLKSNVSLIGTQMPMYNWVVTQSANNYEKATTPTKLVNGTILKGKLYFLDFAHIVIKNLGVDCGTDYIAGGGTENDCIAIGNSGSIPYTANADVLIENVIVLGKNASSLFHGVVIEGSYGVTINNVWTCFATHGIAVKSTGGVSISNTRSWSHASDGIILKGDGMAVGEVNLSDFFISSLDPITGGVIDGGGLQITNFSTVVKNINISNGNIYRTTFGVKFLLGQLLNVNMSKVTAYGASGIGFDITNLYNSRITDCSAFYNGGDGFYVRTESTYSNALKLTNCISNNNGGDGFDLSGATYPVLFSELYTNGNTGYGIRAGSNIYGALFENVGNTAGATTGTITAR